VAVIVGLVWFFARRRGPGERSGADRARDILAERFARGELSVEEYRERLAQL
jgi:putative membrane protein